jgi:hypothetical protein
VIKHIVVFKMKPSVDGKTREENLQDLKGMLESLPGKIPEVRRFEVGVNTNPSGHAYDMALYSEFEDEMALINYQKHPAHQEVVTFVNAVCADRRVVDYEM